MLDKIKFVNHLNESFEFGQNDVYLNENDVRNFTWQFDSYNLRIANFRKAVTSKKLPVKFIGSTRLSKMNSLLNLVDKDAIDEKPGRLYVGDWYIEGYITAGSYSNYTDKAETILEITFTATSGFWFRPTTFHYRSDSYDGGSGLGYPYDYPYAYRSRFNISEITNNYYKPAEFTLLIYGPITNPSVTIAGNVYKVNTTVASNEHLIIDSISKTVTLVKQDGTKENKFGDRDSSGYIFEPIPSGKQAITMGTSFEFDLTLFEERSTPVWT